MYLYVMCLQRTSVILPFLNLLLLSEIFKHWLFKFQFKFSKEYFVEAFYNKYFTEYLLFSSSNLG